jgi:hypothetical protein
MLLTMILVSAILAGAAVLVSLQLSANKGTEVTNIGMRALHCAEAGLAASRATVAANQTAWVGNIGTGLEPSWMNTVTHDLDGDGTADFYITLEDDEDEYPKSGAANDPLVDVNSRIFIVSRCGTMVGTFTPKYADFPREVREMVMVSSANNCYNGQKGGCGANNNMN